MEECTSAEGLLHGDHPMDIDEIPPTVDEPPTMTTLTDDSNTVEGEMPQLEAQKESEEAKRKRQLLQRDILIRKFIRDTTVYGDEFARLDSNRTGILNVKQIQKLMVLRGIRPTSKEEQSKYAVWLREINDACPAGWSFDAYLWFVALVEESKYEERENEIRSTADALGIPKQEVDELRVVFRQVDTYGEKKIRRNNVELLLKKLGVRSSDRAERARDLFQEFHRPEVDGLTFIDFLHLAKKLNGEPEFFREVTY